MNLATAAAEKEVQMNGERLEGGDRHSEGKISQGGAHFGVNEDSTNVQDAKQIPIPAEAKTVSSDGGTISLLTSHKEIEDIESIPKFVHEHSATLSFPEKVCNVLYSYAYFAIVSLNFWFLVNYFLIAALSHAHSS